MSSFDVVNLIEHESVDLGDRLAGCWGVVRLIDLASGATHTFDAAEGEICLFAVDGSGSITMGDNQASVATGVGVTLMKGSVASVAAATPMRLFAAWMTA